MPFALTHKITSYLMVLAAVASLLLSPELSPLATILALVGVGASFFAEPPRYPQRRLAIAWNIVTLLFFFVLIARVLVADVSPIRAGSHFLLLVLVNKLFNRRQSKDYRQIYVLSFLMLVAATTLNTSLTYAVCFIAYIFFAIWALILFHLRREMEDNDLIKHSEANTPGKKVKIDRILASRRIVGGAFFASTSLIALLVILGAAAIFTFFPRVGLGILSGPRRHALTMAGFSEHVRLGQHGTIRDNPQVVMRVRFGPPGAPRKTPPPLSLLWRGAVYDHYTQGAWAHSPAVSGRPRPVTPHDGLFVMNYAPGVDEHASAADLRRTLLRQEIYLEPLNARVIFGADRPVALEIPRRKLTSRLIFTPARGPLGELRAYRSHTAGVLYVAYSQVRRPRAKLLRQASPKARPLLGSVFLQIPDEMPQRVRALAQRITAGKRLTYDKVIAVQRYLQTRYRYSLDLVHIPGREPIDEFLFETRRGHCEYFASAMAILLRAVEIPTRHVNGFAGGEWNDYGSYLAVREGDAHAWTEVFFANVGWIAFDPTPASGTATIQDSSILRTLHQIVDALRLRWSRYVIEYNIGKQIKLLTRVKRLLQDKTAKGASPSAWHRARRP
ncbi:MAG: DUF3488 domain-containing protein, partial [Deltaproteobacteria bacterium]|nr:DUF3488 domain-containing protein [Deltaproteobacteria bacterium]